MEYLFFANGGDKLQILPSSGDNFAWGLIFFDSTDIGVLVHQIEYFYHNLNNLMSYHSA